MREGERDRERKQVFVKEEGMKNSGYLRRNRWPRDKIRRKTPTHVYPFVLFCISHRVNVLAILCVCVLSHLSLFVTHGLYPATLCNPMDCILPGSSVHGIFQARKLEWVAISYSRGSSQPRDQTPVFYISCIAGGFFTTATWEAH